MCSKNKSSHTLQCLEKALEATSVSVLEDAWKLCVSLPRAEGKGAAWNLGLGAGAWQELPDQWVSQAAAFHHPLQSDQSTVLEQAGVSAFPSNFQLKILFQQSIPLCLVSSFWSLLCGVQLLKLLYWETWSYCTGLGGKKVGSAYKALHGLSPRFLLGWVLLLLSSCMSALLQRGFGKLSRKWMLLCVRVY